MNQKIRSEMYVFFDDEVGRMKLEFWGRRVFIHLLVKTSKSSGFRMCRRILRIEKDVKQVCKSLGFEVIEALFPDNKRLERLAQIWGFQVKGRENGLTYMRCPNA